MSATMFLLPLAIATLVLIIWSSVRVISRLRRGERLSLKLIFCLVAALLLVDLLVCLYLLVAAALGHSTHAQEIAPWDCLLSFLIIVVAPTVVLLALRYSKGCTAVEETWSSTRTRVIAAGSALLLAVAFALVTSRSSLWPPLHWAMRNGHPSVTEVLLRLNPNLNATGPYGWTPLTLSVHKEDRAMINELLERGADIDVNGGAPLKRAVLFGKVGIVSLLLESGADPDGGEDGHTPLMIASERGNLEMVQLLIEAGADVERRGSRNQTALSLADKNGHQEIVRLLQENRERGRGRKRSL
jgi:uncharacterized membrane protein YidH (DUF202 family)